MKTKLPWIISALALVVVVIVVLTFVFSSKEDSPEATGENEASVSTSVENESQTPPTDEERPYGAMVDDDRRTWPNPYLDIDDSQHATVGQYSQEMFGVRPVWTPNNPLGDLPKKDQLVNEMGDCSNEGFNLPGKTQIQYVKARYLVVNDVAGPTSMKDAVPTGYAHSLAGAVIAAANQMGYGIPGERDEVGLNVMKQLWATSKEAQRDEPKNVSKEEQEISRPNLVPAVSKFKVISCSENAVVVNVAISPERDAMVFQVPLFWRDGDWKPDFSGTAEDRVFQPVPPTFDEYQDVNYQ